MEVLYVNPGNILIAKSDQKETSPLGGESKVSKKPMEPMKVYSEKLLIREIEKIISMLAPEKEWSIRMKAMQRFESLVLGGATDYPSFPALLKLACHLLSFLSKELSWSFESCAEIFIVPFSVVFAFSYLSTKWILKCKGAFIGRTCCRYVPKFGMSALITFSHLLMQPDKR